MMAETEIRYYTDEWGKWKVVAPLVTVLVEPSQKWIEENAVDHTEAKSTPTIWDELAAAYREGVNSLDQ